MTKLKLVNCSKGHSTVVNRAFEEQLCGVCGEVV